MPERQPLVLSVPEVRDYVRINAQVVRWLDAGHTWIELAGVSSQRLLLAGIAGRWNARIDVAGNAGPELAAGMNAPGLVVTCLGSTADAAGRELAGGTLRILGDVADCAAYRQRGGRILVAGSAGHRAGLEISGGLLAILGETGRLCGERQRGGRIFAPGVLGPFSGFGRDGGDFLRALPDPSPLSAEESSAIDAIRRDRDVLAP